MSDETNQPTNPIVEPQTAATDAEDVTWTPMDVRDYAEAAFTGYARPPMFTWREMGDA